MMRWRNVDTYHLKSDEWTIARYKVGDAVRFILWHGNALIDAFGSVEDAKREAEKGMK